MGSSSSLVQFVATLTTLLIGLPEGEPLHAEVLQHMIWPDVNLTQCFLTTSNLGLAKD